MLQALEMDIAVAHRAASLADLAKDFGHAFAPLFR
jgi:hypothetical protein